MEWECRDCRIACQANDYRCWNCNVPRSAAESPASKALNKQLNGADASNKYPALRSLSTLLNAFSVLVLVMSLLSGAALAFLVGGTMAIGFGIGLSVAGLLQWLLLRAAAESLVVLVDIEHNTRQAALSAQAARLPEKRSAAAA